MSSNTLLHSRKVNTSRVSLPCHKNTKSNSPERKDQEVTPRKCADCTPNCSHYTTCNYLGKPKLESPKNSRHKERPKFFIPYQSRGKKSENFCPTAVERTWGFFMSSRINPCSSWFSVRRPAFNKNKPPPSKFSKAIFAPGGNTFFTAGDHEILESRMRKREGLRSKTFGKVPVAQDVSNTFHQWYSKSRARARPLVQKFLLQRSSFFANRKKSFEKQSKHSVVLQNMLLLLLCKFFTTECVWKFCLFFTEFHTHLTNEWRGKQHQDMNTLFEKKTHPVLTSPMILICPAQKIWLCSKETFHFLDWMWVNKSFLKPEESTFPDARLSANLVLFGFRFGGTKTVCF